MSANDYNIRRFGTAIYGKHITELTRAWQVDHGLVVDGYLGPKTLASIEVAMLARGGPAPGPTSKRRFWPLANLQDGRRPVVTSGSRWHNNSRKNHQGVDMFFRWLDGDPVVPTGDGGALKRNGDRRWWYPPETLVRATEDGKVSYANINHVTGGLIWIEHGEYRTGYMHLSRILVDVGQNVTAGAAIGLPGDNPIARDAKHLHFEVSALGIYRPRPPEDYLLTAEYLPYEKAMAVDKALVA